MSNVIHASSLENGLNQANSWLIKSIGPILIVYGLILGGFRISMGDKNGLKQALYVALGGAIVTSSTSLKDMIISLF